jgi:hypothetical protein
MFPKAMDRISVQEYRELLTTKEGRLAGSAKSKSPRRNDEDALQRAAFSWVRAQEAQYPMLRFLFHPGSGGKRSPGEAGKLKAYGLRPGVPDFLLPMASPGGSWAGLAIELKSAKGVVSVDQVAWLKAFGEKGYLSCVCRDMDSFSDAVLRVVRS